MDTYGKCKLINQKFIMQAFLCASTTINILANYFKAGVKHSHIVMLFSPFIMAECCVLYSIYWELRQSRNNYFPDNRLCYYAYIVRDPTVANHG